MNPTSLPELAVRLTALARVAPSGRAAETFRGGHALRLRQTMIALCADRTMGEHNSPAEAALLVWSGVVTLHSETVRCDLAAGDAVAIPRDRHDLTAREDSVLVLTVMNDVAWDSAP